MMSSHKKLKMSRITRYRQRINAVTLAASIFNEIPDNTPELNQPSMSFDPILDVLDDTNLSQFNNVYEANSNSSNNSENLSNCSSSNSCSYESHTFETAQDYINQKLPFELSEWALSDKITRAAL